MRRPGLLIAVIVACTPQIEGLTAASLVAAEPAPIAVPPPAPTDTPIADARRCGEAGDQPTELPPILAAGRGPAGAGVVHPDETLTIGTVVLRYDRSAWIGTMRAGFRAPGLHIEIDRGEVGEHMPWGALQELHAGQGSRVDVGPYRIDLRAGAGDPPAEVSVAISREVCPPSAVIERRAAPSSLWVSTEGIRFHTYDQQGELLQIGLDGRGDAPRLDITNLGYRHSLEPRPGPPRSFRVAGHTVTLDRVVPGPGTRYTDRWRADGDARLHVRARIEPAPPITLPQPVPSDSPCGDASPARTTLPPVLETLPRVVQTRTLDIGQRGRFGALELVYQTLEIPAHGGGPYREEARQVPLLQVLGDLLGGTSMFGPFPGPRLARFGRDLLRVEAERGGPPDRIRVRRIAMTCPKEHVIPALAAPTHVWLSSVGHAYVTVGDARPTPLSLQLFVDVGDISLGLASEHAHVSRPARPDLVGLAFTLDGHLVEVLDLERGPDDGLAPVVHVQLRVTPQPGA